MRSRWNWPGINFLMFNFYVGGCLILAILTSW